MSSKVEDPKGWTEIVKAIPIELRASFAVALIGLFIILTTIVKIDNQVVLIIILVAAFLLIAVNLFVAVWFAIKKTDSTDTQNKETRLKERVTFDEPSDTYSFDYLKSYISQKYDSNTPFLVVQYGSSVEDDRNANDVDFAILIYGKHYSEVREREYVGHSKKPVAHLARPLDFQFIIIDSFMIGLIMGKPFEISIALDGEVKDAHLLPIDYFK